MNWILNNWMFIVAITAMIAMIISNILTFEREPKQQKIDNVKEWLKWAVLKAEQELGSGTGQAKLHMVYDLAVEKFPWIVNVITFSVFSSWVDESLEWLNNQLSSNNSIQNYVGINNEN